MKYNKRQLWVYIIRDLNHFVHNLHIFTVISILIDEILKDLKDGKEIRIVNFGVLKIEKTKPKKFKDVKTGKIEMSKGNNKLIFRLSRHLKKFVVEKKDEELKNE